MDRIYDDRVDGKIDEAFWTRKMAEYRDQERALDAPLLSIRRPGSDENLLTVKKIFELANKAHFLYVTRNHAERGELLKQVLLNSATDGVSLTPTYRKPFDLNFQSRKKMKNGRGERT